MTYKDRFIEMAKELLEAGEFYMSAIERSPEWRGADFEDYGIRLRALVAEAEASPE